MIAPVQGKVGQAATLEGRADNVAHRTCFRAPRQAGVYQASARSVMEDGRRSPVCATARPLIEE